MIQNKINNKVKKSIIESINFELPTNQQVIPSNSNQIRHDIIQNQPTQQHKIPSHHQSEQLFHDQVNNLPNSGQDINRINQSTLKIKTGKFSQQQQDLLFRSICQWSNERDMDFVQFTNLIVYGKSEIKKYRMWNQICKVLPGRRILSCYRFIKNRIHRNGRKGKWTEQEIKTLLNLVNKNGRNWSFIALKLKRTPQNVKDKYRSLGQVYHNKRNKDFWSFSQLLVLILFIKEQSNTEFFQPELINQLDQAQYHDNISKQQLKNRKRSSKDFEFHNMYVIRKYLKIKDIRIIEGMKCKWSELSKQMGTKSYDDCKNKWRSIINWVYKFSDYSLQEDLRFLDQIINSEKPQLKHHNIYEVIENDRTARQNQIHWDILKKKVKNSGKQNPKQVALKIKTMLQKLSNF